MKPVLKTPLRWLIIAILAAFSFNLLVNFALAQDSGKCEPPPGCPPPGKIRLQIPIPGIADDKKNSCFTSETRFEGGDVICDEEVRVYYVDSFQAYVAGFYNFFIGAIALIAVIMIMIGGFMWLLAAGNASKIGVAKQTIGGALGGLILALSSFLLFNTLNPDIVNLKLQQPAKVDTLIQATTFCADHPDGTKILDGTVEINVVHPPGTDGKTVDIDGFPGNDNFRFVCGDNYSVKQTKADTKGKLAQCQGHFCDSRSVCVDRFGLGEYRCEIGFIGGTISWTGDAYIDNGLELWVVCDDNTSNEIFHIDLPGPDKQASYSLGDDWNKVRFACSQQAEQGIKGFYLRAEVNDQNSLFNTGVDDWFAIDRTCQTPISTADPDNIDWAAVNSAKYVTFDELNQGFTCNLLLDRNIFPDR